MAASNCPGDPLARSSRLEMPQAGAGDVDETFGLYHPGRFVRRRLNVAKRVRFNHFVV
jgi:hypothetical protein